MFALMNSHICTSNEAQRTGRQAKNIKKMYNNGRVYKYLKDLITEAHLRLYAVVFFSMCSFFLFLGRLQQ